MHIQLMCLLVIAVVIVLANESDNSHPPDNDISLRRNMLRRNRYKRENRNHGNSSIEEAVKFMQKVNDIDLKLSYKVSIADYSYQTNLSDYNQKIFNEREKNYSICLLKYKEEAKKFDWKSFMNVNATLYRWFKLFLNAPSFDSMQKFKLSASQTNMQSMPEIFSKARVCPYDENVDYNGPNMNRTNCLLEYEPDMMNIMGNSRNPDELKSLWHEFRDATGRKMRKVFITDLIRKNAFAKEMGFSDYGHLLINEYESKDFVDNMAKVVKDILPLYKQFHAYVRRKLIQFYKRDMIMEDGPIPSHLLGDMYAQYWLNIFDIVNPFPNTKSFPNVTEAILKKKMSPLDMFVIAEKFFLSLGLERMTPYFWAGSVIEKPTDRHMVCHAFAMDFFNGKDFRIRQCTERNEKSLQVVHHEMGHIQYHMLYKHLPRVFRDGANPGFHEAVGDVTSLSAITIDYLKKVSLLKEDFEETEETDIIHLLKAGLTYLPTLPYSYVLDHYRYQVFNGSIKACDLNKSYWKIRLDYQGVCPPVNRSEEDFDAGAKYHVAYSIGFMRYFFANVFEFQIHKSLCQKANHRGPLHKCNLFNSKAAGNLLREALSLGKSRHWKKVMLKLTGETELSASAYLEYFQPLAEWLKKQNKGEYIGWNSEDPMKCPTKKQN